MTVVVAAFVPLEAPICSAGLRVRPTRASMDLDNLAIRADAAVAKVEAVVSNTALQPTLAEEERVLVVVV